MKQKEFEEPKGENRLASNPTVNKGDLILATNDCYSLSSPIGDYCYP